jgi:hypothetical protein
MATTFRMFQPPMFLDDTSTPSIIGENRWCFPGTEGFGQPPMMAHTVRAGAFAITHRLGPNPFELIYAGSDTNVARPPAWTKFGKGIG